MSKTDEEVQAAKVKLRKDILALCGAFHLETGRHVRSIQSESMTVYYVSQPSRRMLSDVRIEIDEER